MFPEARKAHSGQVQARKTVQSPHTNPKSLHRITGRVTCIRCQALGYWYIIQKIVHTFHTLDEWVIYWREKTWSDPTGVWSSRRLLKSKVSERGWPHRVIWLFAEHHTFLSTCNCLTSYSPPADLQGMVIPSLQIRKLRLIEGPCFASKVAHGGNCQKPSVVRRTNAERSPLPWV